MIVGTDLTRVRAYVEKHPNEVMTSLYHHVTDVDNLRSCYEGLDGSKTTGTDGVTKKDYGVNLEENLASLSQRLKDMGYCPKDRRRSYIPKAGSEKGRPLAIRTVKAICTILPIPFALGYYYSSIPPAIWSKISNIKMSSDQRS